MTYNVFGGTLNPTLYYYYYYCVFSALEMSYDNALYKSILHYIRLHYIRLQTIY